MRRSVVIIIIVGVVAVAIMLGWFGTGSRTASIPTPSEGVANSATPGPANTTLASPNPSGVQPKTTVASPGQPTTASTVGPVQAGTSPAPDSAPNDLITNWEDRIDQILVTEGPEGDKARQMLEMFPRVSSEGQLELSQHLANLLPDEDYPSMGKYLTDPKLSEDVLDELMADVLNRPNSIKLPYLLEVAKQSQHPKASEARDLVELFLEEDYGNDWSKWQAKMTEWLKENPD